MNRSAVPRVFFGRTRNCSSLFAYGRADAILPGTLTFASFFSVLVSTTRLSSGEPRFKSQQGVQRWLSRSLLATIIKLAMDNSTL
jgi:hypothetical protein